MGYILLYFYKLKQGSIERFLEISAYTREKSMYMATRGKSSGSGHVNYMAATRADQEQFHKSVKSNHILST